MLACPSTSKQLAKPLAELPVLEGIDEWVDATVCSHHGQEEQVVPLIEPQCQEAKIGHEKDHLDWSPANQERDEHEQQQMQKSERTHLAAFRESEI